MVKLVQLSALAPVLLLAVSVSANNLDVQAKGSVSVRPGEEAELSCTTDAKVKFCTFFSPDGSSYGIDPDINNYANHVFYADSCAIRVKTQETDNGEWRCEITSVIDGSAVQGSNSITLTVLKAPGNVKLNVNEEVNVIPPETGINNVKCEAFGGHPTPSFSWTLDGQPANVDVIAEQMSENGDSYYQEVSYAARKEDNGKKLTCVANSKAYTDEDLANGINTASTTLNIQFKPVFVQSVYDFYGLTVGKPFEIRISFKLNPGPINTEWIMQDGTKVPQGSQSEDGKYTSKVAELSPLKGSVDTYTALLTINEVSEKDADTVNILKVTNLHGEAEIKFKMALGDKPPVEAGTGPVIAIVIIVLILIVVIAVAVVARSQGLLCFATGEGVPDAEKGKFEALEDKDDTTPEKDIKKEAVQSEVPVVATKQPEAGDAKSEDKKSNGNTSPTV